MKTGSIPHLNFVLAAALCLIVSTASAQMPLDTLLYDTFDNNRLKWPTYQGEKGSTTFEDGAMHLILRQPNGSYQLLLQPITLKDPDTLVMELKLTVDAIRQGGLVYGLNRGRNGKNLNYQALTRFPKGISSYDYYSQDNNLQTGWISKDATLLVPEMTFRVQYARLNDKEGRYDFFVNGKHLKTMEVRSRLDQGWQEVGMVFKGYCDVKVDHFLLLAIEHQSDE